MKKKKRENTYANLLSVYFVAQFAIIVITLFN